MSPPKSQTSVRGGRFPTERIRAQRLLDPPDATPAEVVADLLAVQAQDGLGTKWAVGVRTPRGASTEARIDEALAAGTILRTHVMRWTWQLITPADVRWMLALVAPRLVAGAAGRDRQLELDAKQYRKANTALERAMRDGAHLTRAEIVEVLERAKVSPEGQRLSHILGHAELAGVITSGVTRGRQTTHAHLDLRAPNARPPMPRDEALAEAALRYFRSRGPATDADFAWWIWLSLTDARAGLAAVRDHLVSEEVEVAGKRVTMWRGIASTSPMKTPDVHLLPAFDEYLVAYKDRANMLAPEHVRHHNAGGGLLAPTDRHRWPRRRHVASDARPRRRRGRRHALRPRHQDAAHSHRARRQALRRLPRPTARAHRRRAAVGSPRHRPRGYARGRIHDTTRGTNMNIGHIAALAAAVRRTLLGSTVAHATSDDGAAEGFVRIMNDNVQWVADADGSGMQRAVIAGDPSQPGLYVIRVKFPAGTMSRNHWHREDRHATVISGTWWTGTGDDFEPDKTIGLKPGSYMKHPGGAHHFDGAKDEDAVVQIVGIGPSETTRLHPELGNYGPSTK